MRNEGALRVATYNVHACAARDGRGLARVADLLAELDCDVIALQEVDVGRLRSGVSDQASEIARRLGLASAFGAAWDRGPAGAYGNAVLSRFPILESTTHALPEAKGLRCEPRSVIEVRLETPLGTLEAWCTHLGVRRHEREAQGRALVERLASRTSDAPLVVLGDLNAGTDAPLVQTLGARLVDARRGSVRPSPTYPARWPIFTLDHIFVGAALRVRSAEVVRGPLAAIASDHLPFVATLGWASSG